MTVAWSNDIVIQLIDVFKSYELLWDTSHADYKNKTKKNNAWEDIGKVFGLPRREVESKIHNLRSQFIRERKKNYKSKTTGSKKSSWFAYRALTFLVTGAPTPSHKNSLEIKIEHEENSSDFQNNEDAPAKTATAEKPVAPQIKKSSLKRKGNEERLDEAYRVMRNVQKRMMSSAQDEFDVYGQYVASELRGVKDEHSVIMAKYYLNNVLIEARMGKYKRRQNYETAPSSNCSSE